MAKHAYQTTTNQSETDVASPSPEWKEMEVYRELPRDLRAGTIGLQRQSGKHLWQAPRERDKDFARRLKALQFEPFYWSSAELIGGQPFTQMIGFSDDTPPEIKEWNKDIDGTGRDLRSFARTACIGSVGYGIQFLWPKWDDEKQRPYLWLIPEDAVLDPYEEGQPVRVLMVEEERDPDKPWLRVSVEQVWIFYDGDPTAGAEERYARWEVYEHKERTNPKSEWKETPEEGLGGFFKPLDRMPLVPLFTGSNSPENNLPWMVLPPLHPLAVANRVWMNKRSDLDFGLWMANVPQKTISGISEDEVKKIDTVSYKGVWWSSNPQTKFAYLEHSGASFEVSRLDMNELERRMEVLGLMPNVSRADASQAVTATGEMRDMSRAITTSQAWALGWQDSFETALRMMALYRRFYDGFTLEFHTSFGPKERDLERLRIVQQDYVNGDLEPEFYYPEAKRLGGYTEAFNADAAAAAATKRRKANLAAFSALPAPRPAEDQPAAEA